VKTRVAEKLREREETGPNLGDPRRGRTKLSQTKPVKPFEAREARLNTVTSEADGVGGRKNFKAFFGGGKARNVRKKTWKKKWRGPREEGRVF